MVEDLLTFDKAKLYCNSFLSNIISVYYQKKKRKKRKRKEEAEEDRYVFEY